MHSEVMVDPVANLQGLKLELISETHGVVVYFSSQEMLRTFVELMKVWTAETDEKAQPAKRKR